MVKSLIKVQDAYINTYHPDFMGGANSIVNVFDVNSYNKQLNEEALKKAAKDNETGFSVVDDEGNMSVKPVKGQAQTRKPFGGEMLI